MAPSLDVRVRPHLFSAAGLLVLAALAAPVATLPRPLVPGHVPLLLLLLAMTLLLEGIAFWYLPSFAKRAVTPVPLAQAGPWLALVAGGALVAGALLGILRVPMAARPTMLVASSAASLLLLAFAAVLVLSGAAGRPWRGGVPFWRKEGPFRAGDRVALVAFVSAAAWSVVAAGFLAAAPLDPLAPGVLAAWIASLALLVLGSLAHLLPRGRGAPFPAPFVLGGLVLVDVGTALLVLPGRPLLAPATLASGLVLAAVGLGVHAGGRAKPAGPRTREARPFLFSAWLVLVAACVALVATPWRPDLALMASGGLAIALLLALAGLSLLTLPVLFNQRPNARLTLPAALAGGLGYALVAAGVLLPAPALLGLGAQGLSLFLVLWLATLWPLRRPRRDCPTPATAR